jgi:hypothetical protein
MFIYTVGSDQPDDDESCFVAQGGSWILQYVSWDLVNDWQLPDAEFNNSVTSRFFFGSGYSAITSIGGGFKIGFNIPVPGALVGGQVVASPAYKLQSGDTGTVGFYGVVETPGIVTVYLFSQFTSGGFPDPGIWNVAVINN